MPSPSVSALHVSRSGLIAFSCVSGSRSLSSSESSRFGVPSPSQSAFGSTVCGLGGAGGFSAPTIGELERDVKRLPNVLERTRTRRRVRVGVPFLTNSSFSRRLGSVTLSILVVPFSALTNMTRAPLRLNATVFLFRPRRKWWPRIVSVWPTNTFLGVMLLTTGARVLALADVPATAGTSSAVSAASRPARRSIGRVRARSSIAPGIGAPPLRLERIGGGAQTLIDDYEVLRGAREHGMAVLGDHHEILDPHAAATRQIHAGLHRHDVPDGQLRLRRCAQPRRLVDLHPDAVAEPVAEVLAVPGRRDDVARHGVDLAPRR